MRLLLVDDDGVNRYTVSKALQRVGYVVSEVASAEAALERYGTGDFDLVLAEVNLPGGDGLALLRTLKERAPDAIVILLAENPEVEMVVQALRFGAEDFLIKPISSDEIRESVERGMAAARSLRRRRRLLDAIERTVSDLSREVSDNSTAPMPDIAEADGLARRSVSAQRGSAISLGPLSVLPGKYQIVAGEASVSLTPTEFDLLLYLAAHRGRVIACSELVREVRGYQSDETEAREVIRPHVSNLRRKLRGLGDIDLIVNVRGVGYRLGEVADSD